MRKCLALSAAIGVCAAVVLTASGPQQPAPKVDFVRDVQPILREHCYECHGSKQQKNGLRLDRRRDAMRGGTQTIIGPGSSDSSKLYHRLIGSRFGRQMPPDGAIPPSQIATIKAWIDAGAEWPDSAAGDVRLPPPDRGATMLMNALRSGDSAAFTRLVATNPHAVNRRGTNGATPLMYAVLYSDVATVRTLLDRGADPNVADHAGATALIWAVDDLEKATLLVQRGAKVNVRSADGRTPLLIAAARRGATPVVRLLLERGADPPAKGPARAGEASPLLMAFRSGEDSTVRLFLERGADPRTITPGSLITALHNSCEGCATAAFKALDADGVSATLVNAVPPRNSGHLVTRLLAAGADPNAKDPEGRSVLILAASSDNVPEEAVQTLLDRGADVNAKTPAGETALGMARLRGDTPIVRLLVRAGARDADAPPAAPSGYAPAASARQAVERSLPLLQRTDATFLKKSGCVSCHHNSLTAMTVAVARTRGISVDEPVARQQVSEVAAYLDRWRDRVLQGISFGGGAFTTSYILLGLADEHYPADEATDAMARYLLGQQLPGGAWRHVSHRPPIEASDIQVTATCLRALQVYAPATRNAEYKGSIDRAAVWIAAAKPVTTEDRVFQLLGLQWSGAPAADIQARAGALLAEQRPDGGWSQLKTLESDAYATGQALVALVQSGAVPVSDPAYARGVQFLVRTQFADGSWFVRSRSLPIQPHFETGFPFGRDQFISAAATNWAAMALALGARTEVPSAAEARRPGAR
jgi:ankyrin repeat protein